MADVDQLAADFDKPTGTKGTLRIRDTGSVVEYWVLCSDPATNVAAFTWSGVVNGAPVGGTINLPAGFGSRLLGSWTVSSTQHVTFHMNATGTQGLGGPTDHGADISRGPVATVPPPPVMEQPDQITTSSMRIRFTAQGDGGSPLIDSEVTYARSADFTLDPVTVPSGGETILTGLLVGTKYWITARVRNAVGISGYAAAVAASTLTGVRVWNGSAWQVAEPRVWNGSAWVLAEVRVWNGSEWVITA